MSDININEDDGPLPSPETDVSPDSGRLRKPGEGLAPPKDASREDGSGEDETVDPVRQDDVFKTMSDQAKATGDGTDDYEDELNRDG